MSDDKVMGPARLEAFSDGVIAVIITIMVLELKVPHGDDPALLLSVWPVFFSYVVSFVTVAIYWVNHHRMFHLVHRVDNAVLWTNMIWLFFTSLIPFATSYISENHISRFGAAVYATVLMFGALAFLVLRSAAAHGHLTTASELRIHRAAQRKNLAGIACYVVAIACAYVEPWLTLAICALVAAAYFIPDAWLPKDARAHG